MYITNRELDLSNKKLIVEYINNIKKYSKEEAIEAIENYKRITNEEEKIKMRNEIASHYLGKALAVCFMYKKNNRALNWEDLFQECYISIIKAIDCTAKNEKIESFDSYLNYWIRGAVYRTISKNSYNIRIPERAFQLHNKYMKLRAKYNKENSYLTEEELLFFAKELNTSVENLRVIEKLPMSCYLDVQIVDCFSDKRLLNEEENNNCKSCEELVVEKLYNEQLKKEVDSLPEEQKEVLKRRYGFYGDPQAVHIIAKEMKHGKRRIKELEKRGLFRLKNKMK